MGLKCRTAAAAECGCMGSIGNQYPALLHGLPPGSAGQRLRCAPRVPRIGDRAGGRGDTKGPSACRGLQSDTREMLQQCSPRPPTTPPCTLGWSQGSSSPRLPTAEQVHAAGTSPGGSPASCWGSVLEARADPALGEEAASSKPSPLPSPAAGMARWGDRDTKGSIRNDSLIGGR